ncbi:glycosyltransferase family 4 protein [Algibacillus agarilyticus]|uniref:glycosyltransferase family 4 protein n=1 Tax=Algibacillus agarilyticus TaxID=2234133 RepID=UPI000DD06560|nr:glycosyltransferase family 4 protein [Algibacillus agarilyticus]
MHNDNEIWQVVDSRNFGGIESHILQLSDGLLKQGYKTRVVFLKDYGSHPILPSLDKCNIPYLFCRDGQSTLRQLVATHAPALLHTHGYKAGIISRLIGKMTKTPVVSTYHAGESPKGKVRIYDWFDRYTAFIADQRLVVSEQIQHKLPVKSEIVKNFIDVNGLTQSKGNEIAFVGRLSHEKGIHHLLNLCECLPHITIHCYGDGPEMPKLQADSPSNLKIHGQQNDMATVWPKIGLLLIPSLYEGMPMVALEAMGRGIPVVASKVGGLPSLINHGINGWLKEAGDIEGFANCIKVWLSISDEIKNELSADAKETIHCHYSIEASIPHLINRYSQIVKGAS